MKKTIFIIVLLLLLVQILYASKSSNQDWFSHDKFSHLTSSAFFYCWNYNVIKNGFQLDSNRSKVISFSIVNLIGLTKEIIDYKQPDNKFSYKDIIYSFGGNILGLLIFE